MSDYWSVDYRGERNSTNIVDGTSAEFAYNLWLEKKAQMAKLEYECDMLVDKYHDEMGKANIPACLGEQFIMDLFDKKNTKQRKSAREFFLKFGFSKGFVEKNSIVFSNVEWHGYSRHAARIVLGIGDYLYTIEVPIPRNVRNKKDRGFLMGEVKFRVDRIHKSKEKEFFKEMEAVQMPTYDWKKCFEAIEADVAKTK